MACRSLYACCCALLLGTLLAGCQDGKNGKQTAEAGGWGDAPDFSFVIADGSTAKLSDYAGKPIVVNFWDDG